TQATDSLPQWAAEDGHEVVAFDRTGDAGWTITVRKGASARSVAGEPPSTPERSEPPAMPDAERGDALPKRRPDWCHDAPLGIFIHWGAYAVPAWAELGAELGAADDGADRLTRNPYAEWYANTIRIEGSPAAEHHRTVHGDAPYDDFLDQWRPDAFDPAAW